MSNQSTPPGPVAAESKFGARLLKARHDFHNSISHILGFGELWLEELQETGDGALKTGLRTICQTAAQMMARVNEDLVEAKLEAAPAALGELQRQLVEQASRIIGAAEGLARQPQALTNQLLKSDLARIAAAARLVYEVASNTIPAAAGRLTSAGGDLAQPLPGELAVALEEPAPDKHLRQGAILVVDDHEVNRELLSRRLSRMGYFVQVAESGERALETVATDAVDLILLDILMPGLDGIEVLHRLKADPRTRHIPVIMLSSADEIDTVVRCIHLGADDFLPKPFNATLLMARIESSLSKKHLRDQETAFLKQLQAEQDTSERLLLNILPRPIAERLKQGEKIIADSFPEATVLFSDFVDFTSLSSGVPAKILVGRLNEIFSAFDHLCEGHGLEKIKMIGDAYMAVGGVPTPLAGHAEAAAELALAMQKETARFLAGDGRPFRLRIGLNTGPVVAGVIGAKKFAYDLWGDTVNLASRMEAHAPAGGILVTASTYQRLRKAYSFKPGRVIRVKGKGEVLSYLLFGKKRVSS